jgi:hypothetical protein
VFVISLLFHDETVGFLEEKANALGISPVAERDAAH